MKTNNQFAALTEAEALNINGGGLLDTVLGNASTVANSLGGSVGILAAGGSAALVLVGAGAGNALTSTGTGLGTFLSKLTVPTTVAI